MNQFIVYFNLRRKINGNPPIYVYGLTLSAERSSSLYVKFEQKDQSPALHGLKLNQSDLSLVKFKNKIVNLQASDFLKYFNPLNGKFCFDGYDLIPDPGFYERFQSTIKELQQAFSNQDLNLISSDHYPDQNQISSNLNSNLILAKPRSAVEILNQSQTNRISNNSYQSDRIPQTQIHQFQNQQVSIDEFIQEKVKENVINLMQLNNIYDDKLNQLTNLYNLRDNNNNQALSKKQSIALEKYSAPPLIDLNSSNQDSHCFQHIKPYYHNISSNISSYLAKSHNIDDLKPTKNDQKQKLSASSSIFRDHKPSLDELLKQNEEECLFKHNENLLDNLRTLLQGDYLLEWFIYTECKSNNQSYDEFKNHLQHKFGMIEKRNNFKNEIKEVDGFNNKLEVIMNHFTSLSLDDAINLNLVLCKKDNLDEFIEEANIYKSNS